MTLLEMSFLVVVIVAILVPLGWRFASRRKCLPCPPWLSWLVEMDNPFARENRAATIVGHLDLRPGMKVLDIGCGPGRLTIPVAEGVGPQGEVVAVDIQPAMIESARQKARTVNLRNIRFSSAGVAPGNLEPGRYDRALLVTVLGEMLNGDVVLNAVFDALKPGGILSVTELIFDPHFQTRGKVVQVAASAGFREKSYFGNRLAYTLHLEKPVRGILEHPEQPGSESITTTPPGDITLFVDQPQPKEEI